MTTAPDIEVRGLTKSYGDHAVLMDVDLSVAPGTIFALLGSNGAGQTTVVRILATLLTAEGGTAAVAGYDVAEQPAKVRESISLTGQFAAVDEILTGRENLMLIAQLRRLKYPGRVAEGLLARFALTDAAGRRAPTYSGGMRRRVDIAMSLIGTDRHARLGRQPGPAARGGRLPAPDARARLPRARHRDRARQLDPSRGSDAR